MTRPIHPTKADLQAVTEARLSLGPHKGALKTKDALAFSLDHARAQEAVRSEMPVAEIGSALDAYGLSSVQVVSAAQDRETFIKRPDMGRAVSEGSKQRLAGFAPCDVALVLGDGLSAIAVALNGVAFIQAIASRLEALSITVSPVILARQARVAIGDDIAIALNAQSVIMALGERPGLSAADSLGIYVTHRPEPNTPDSRRNCISNVRQAGLSIDEAAHQTEQLLLAMRQLGTSGVELSNAMHSGVIAHTTQEPD